MLRSLRSVLLLLVVLAPGARAQLAEAQPGARMRIQAPGIVAGRYVGTVLSRTADTLVLGSPNATPVRVPISRISSAEVSRGSSRGLGALQGLKWGVPIGLAIGVLAAVSSDNPDDYYCGSLPDCGQSDGSYKAGLIGGGILGGAIWGAGIGALVGRERWERFDVTPRTSFDVRHGRARLGFSVGF
jgi:hypothetical protein